MTVAEGFVLVVGRAPAIGASFCEGLDDLGLRVREALSADEALLSGGPVAKFDLLVTTVRMPGSLNGLSLATLARRFTPQIKIILIARNPTLTHSWLADAVFNDTAAPGTILRRAEQLLLRTRDRSLVVNQSTLSAA
jgi:CheY-like chemotaxis protein